VDFFPSKIDFPFESLPWTRALGQHSVSVFKIIAETHRALTRVHGRHQRLIYHHSRTTKIARPTVSVPETIGKNSGSECSPTVETSSAFLGSFARSTTGPCPAHCRPHQLTETYTRSGNQNLTSDVEDCNIFARVHIRQRFAVCELVGNVRILQEFDAFVVLERLKVIRNHELTPGSIAGAPVSG